MTLLLLLAACCVPLGPRDEAAGPAGDREALPPLPEAPARLPDPAQSAAARPAWATSTDYAPQAAPEVAALARSAQGPLREALLACSLRSSMVENHLRKRNNVPDLDVRLSWGDNAVLARGPDNTAELVVTAPLVSLEPQATVTAQAWDRGWLFRRQLGAVTLTHTGFPAQAEAEGLLLACGQVPRDAIEPLLARTLEDCGQAIQSWSARADLQAERLDPSSQGQAALDLLERAAGLVGWADPRVQARTQQLGDRRARYLADLRRAVEEQRRALPEGWTAVGQVAWAPATVATDEGRVRVSAPVRPVEGPVAQLGGALPDLQTVQLVDVEGRVLDLLYEGLVGAGDEPLRAEDRASWSALSPDASTLRPPLLLRTRLAERWVFQRAEPELD